MSHPSGLDTILSAALAMGCPLPFSPSLPFEVSAPLSFSLSLMTFPRPSWCHHAFLFFLLPITTLSFFHSPWLSVLHFCPWEGKQITHNMQWKPALWGLAINTYMHINFLWNTRPYHLNYTIELSGYKCELYHWGIELMAWWCAVLSCENWKKKVNILLKGWTCTLTPELYNNRENEVAAASDVHLRLGAEPRQWKSVSCRRTHARAPGAPRCLFSHCKIMSYHQKTCEEHIWIMNGGEVNYGWREGRCNALDISLKHMVGYMATDPLHTPWRVTSRRDSLIS